VGPEIRLKTKVGPASEKVESHYSSSSHGLYDRRYSQYNAIDWLPPKTQSTWNV